MSVRRCSLLFAVFSLGCSLLFRVQAEVGAACADKKDNDRDGKFDCLDESCFEDPACLLTGEACAADEECAAIEQGEQICLTDQIPDSTFTNGYCSEFCDSVNPSQACSNPNATCVDLEENDADTKGLCFTLCALTTDCRADEGYGCLPLRDGRSICVAVPPEDCANTFDDDLDGLPSCNDPDCAADSICAPGQGAVGDACFAPDDCSSNGTLANAPICLSEEERGFPGGYCADFCDVSNNSQDCEAGSVCLPANDPEDPNNPNLGFCLALCDTLNVGLDCRDGYSCFPLNIGTAGLCLPNCVDSSQCPETQNCNIDIGFCTPPEDCNNGVDDDGDGLIDCDSAAPDLDCINAQACG